MKPNSQKPSPRRESLLGELSSITTMLRGTLAAEHRPRPDSRVKDAARRGPYFKHQVWEDGRNVSRRVPAHQTQQLHADIANAKRFDAITTELAQLNIAHTRALRAAAHEDAAQSEAQRAAQAQQLAGKKNFKSNARSKSSPKPRRSSPGPERASRPKA